MELRPYTPSLRFAALSKASGEPASKEPDKEPLTNENVWQRLAEHEKKHHLKLREKADELTSPEFKEFVRRRLGNGLMTKFLWEPLLWLTHPMYNDHSLGNKSIAYPEFVADVKESNRANKFVHKGGNVKGGTN